MVRCTDAARTDADDDVVGSGLDRFDLLHREVLPDFIEDDRAHESPAL
jgi:hypothetical protein